MEQDPFCHTFMYSTGQHISDIMGTCYPQCSHSFFQGSWEQKAYNKIVSKGPQDKAVSWNLSSATDKKQMWNQKQRTVKYSCDLLALMATADLLEIFVQRHNKDIGGVLAGSCIFNRHVLWNAPFFVLPLNEILLIAKLCQTGLLYHLNMSQFWNNCFVRDHEWHLWKPLTQWACHSFCYKL